MQSSQSIQKGLQIKQIFVGSGEMGKRLRDHDWSKTALGPIESWPESLKSSLSIAFNCQYPIAIYWGHEGYLFYNDAWRPIVGDKHPWALGHPGKEVWPEIWNLVGPVFENVFQTKQGSFQPNSMLPMKRFGYTEECYFDYTFSPIIGADGNVEGILNVVTETTYQVLNERRTKLLREIAASASISKNVSDSCEHALKIMGNDPADIPFALLYLIESEGKQARLSGITGINRNTNASAETIDLTASSSSTQWPLSQLFKENKTIHVDDVIARFGTLLSATWNEPVRSAVILTMENKINMAPNSFLIVGVNPRRALDSAYQDFYNFLANTVETVISHARAYEAEKKRAEMLAELDKAKTVFFSNISHEFRTPLTLMISPLEDSLADAQSPLSQTQKQRQTLIYRNASRLLKLVNTLLDFSRIEANRIQAIYEPTDLPKFTAELVSMFQSAMEKANLKFTIDISVIDEPVYIDKEMWEKIIFNLLSNAFKFTLQGEIKVILHKKETSIELIVQDTGVGILASELPHLFERFHRIEGSKGRSYEGSGIGLALIKELVKLHGGTIQVTSQEGQGSTFSVTIPLGFSHLPVSQLGHRRESHDPAALGTAFVEEAKRWLPEPESQVEKSSLLSSSQQVSAGDSTNIPKPVSIAPNKSVKILLADDNTDMRQYIKGLIEPFWQVCAVNDGEAALEKALVESFDLILSDVMMPRLTGFELLQKLRNNPRTQLIPVILLSARAGEEARIEGLKAGADDYLTKPFSAKELIARINTHLELGALRIRLEEQVQLRTLALNKANTALQVSEKRYRTLAQATHSVVWVANSLGHFVDPQSMWGQFTGQSWQQQQGQGWLNAVHPDDQERVKSTWAQAVKDHSIYHSLLRLLTQSGTYKYVIIRAVPLSNEQGEITEWVGTCLDIHALKQTEENLRAETNYLNLALDSANIGTWSWDLVTQKLDVDNKILQMFNISPEAFNHTMAQGFGSVHPDDVARIDALLKRSIAENLPYEAEFRIIKKDKKIYHIASRAKVYYNEQKQPIRMIGSAWDITLEKERQLLKEVENYRQKLEESIDTLCHELRNPLNGIYGNIELLKDDLELIEALTKDFLANPSQLTTEKLYEALTNAKERLETLKQCAEQQKVIVDDLLDLSKLASGKLELVPVPFDLRHLIVSLTQMVSPHIAKKNLKLEIDLPEENCLLKADVQRLSQVILNLLTNAAKFTKEGSIQVIAVVQPLSPHEAKITIAVKDTGIGMTEEEQSKLFKRFSQIHNKVSGEFGGSGLGLVISKQLIEKMGGSIEVESKKWFGSQFSFTINCALLTPEEQAEFHNNTKKRFNEKSQAVNNSIDNKSVLVVEDNLVNQKLLVKFLEQQGLICYVADNGMEALLKVEQFRFDLIFMDIEMPKMDGLEATRQIRAKETQLNYKVPIIGLSGNARKEQMDAALKAGMNDYLTKPYHKIDLYKILEKFAQHNSPSVKKAKQSPLVAHRTVKDAAPVASVSAVPQSFFAANSGHSNALQRYAEQFKLDANVLLKQRYPFIAAYQDNKIVIYLPVEVPFRTQQLCEFILRELQKYLAKQIEIAKDISTMDVQAERLIITTKNTGQTKNIVDVLMLAGFDGAFNHPQAQTLIAETNEIEIALAASMIQFDPK